ncbi:hypothetical protein [Halobacillus litoralis]|uniref:Uncharacterized protein n=1 Tax=Halobacillus litoralis TaxID=45668 RepID=A0A410MA94_9BACI|nr:hypothetical protein [Halobacillus litoralis]QAS51586.1 hypothetical protein HLI_04765 [Halobacillus litoralis]
MFQMNESQKEEFDELMHSLRNAESIEETRYYFAEIQQYLDTLQAESGSSIQKVDDSHLKEYESLKKKMIDANTKKEVHFYENKIHELIDELDVTKM